MTVKQVIMRHLPYNKQCFTKITFLSLDPAWATYSLRCILKYLPAFYNKYSVKIVLVINIVYPI